MEHRSTKPLLYVAAAVPALYLLTQLFGYDLFSDGWAFAYWQALPGWYPIVWTLCGIVAFFIIRALPAIESRLKAWLLVVAGLVVPVTLFWWLRFDSSLYGGGNLRVAQLGQMDRLIARWFEWGTTYLTYSFFRIARAWHVSPDKAAFLSWQVLALASAIAALIATILIVRKLTEHPASRVLFFLILTFGGQALVYFGFAGIEPVVVAITCWFMYVSLNLHTHRRHSDLAWLWGVLLIGLIMYAAVAYLLPAAVYFTCAHMAGRKGLDLRPLIVATVCAGLALLIVYIYAASSLEFSKSLLFFRGKSPYSDYGIFSIRHIVDWLQMIFLVAPSIVLGICLAFRRGVSGKASSLLTGWTLAAVSGLLLVFVLDPQNGIALDLPRFVAYLTPVSFALVLWIQRAAERAAGDKHFLPILVTIALLAPCAYFPAYLRISIAEKYLPTFLGEREPYYRLACVSFRDAYAERRDLDQADHWDALLPVKSPDFMNYRGCTYLADRGNTEEAIRRLLQTIVKIPFWTEPRVAVAHVQMTLGRYDVARAQIDTCLMLEPDNRRHLTQLYACYRDQRNYPQAVQVMDRLLYLYPGDLDVKTDQMILNMKLGQTAAVDSLADLLLQGDSTRAYPYLVKGILAENRQNASAAVRFYKSFLQYGRKEPDTGFVQERLRVLQPDSTKR